VATLLAFPVRSTRPVVVHTFHGHSLSGYFSSRAAGVFRDIERFLARHTDILVAVSPEVRDDLIRLGVAPAEKFTVVPLGFDLSRFTGDGRRAERRAALRKEWGIGPDERVVTLVARLVPIKRVDRFLRVAKLVNDQVPARFVIVGDGELRHELESSDDARTLGDRLIWAGFRRDMPDVCFASEVVVLTSDNEGTPVSLIEAQASAVPVVGSEVGGVTSAVRNGETGYVVPAEDPALAAAIARVIRDPDQARRLAQAGRTYATRAFSMDRLVDDLKQLYARLLSPDPDQSC
jgi:glycosyltransferase involved in cell wall biosynthesis